VPSPIAHCSLALALWPPLRRRLGPVAPWRRGVLMLGLLAALVAPDLDILADPLLGRAWFESHGGALHSLAAGVVFGVVFALACRLIVPLRLRDLWLAGTAAYCSHVVLDACTRGRGVALLWPLWPERIALPVPLFIGVHHGPDELGRWDLHAAMVASELAFAALVWLAVRWMRRRAESRDDIAHTHAHAAVEGA